ncbi:putative bifunctional diguanylate cyclase/phosphodiesterase [Metapseudomonas otitidis]|uniref:putative bifunctional diguanylate cyclase/phosphodiesterase n=1 Tax=Metapseudomonas otitidis TaxID=319939 RepID=UPI00280A7FE4|nr:EAL domain-containing protein [Pseudomonas otitidis]
MQDSFSSEPVILIVDDQASDVLILSEAIRDLASIHVANGGTGTLDVARACRPDVVLLDIQMPLMDGFEICRAIKSDPKLRGASVLFVTAHSGPENELKALESGALGFIRKPLNLPLVRAHVRAHLDLREQAKRVVCFDALTGLPNRALLQDRAAQAIQKSRRSEGRVAMLMLDLDNFKFLNDTIGHSVGDQVLREVAQRLSAAVRSVDTVSRQGGDEFVVLLPDVQGFDAVGDFADRLLGIIAQPLLINGNRYDLSGSIGISFFPDDCDNFESLYRYADAAMYQAKQEGRNRFRFFSEQIENSTRARHMLERHMRRALEQRVFEVFYQAKVDVTDGRPSGVEALVRWRTSDGQLVSPADFIPLAEETGLIIPIGKFVMLQACNDAQRMIAMGWPVCMSVNISAVQFREESFLGMVTAILEESGLPPNHLELEITEGVLAHDIDRTRATLLALKEIGVRIAIDDFGTGYSSLAYLKRLPIDVLKIDQSFVREMLTDRSDAAIIEAVIRLAQALDLELVAEGVECPRQARRLQELGCRLMQGYLFCRPVPFEPACDFLAEHYERPRCWMALDSEGEAE